MERTLLIKDGTGEFKVTVPDGAKLTFGPDVPFEGKAERQFGQRSYSLRVYEDQSKANLIACFNNVAWFRDIAIPHARLVIREEGKSLWKSDEDGYEVQQSATRTAEFVDSAKLLGTGTTVKAKSTKKSK